MLISDWSSVVCSSDLSLAVAVLGAAQAALTRANRELHDQAFDLAEANTRLHAQTEEPEKAEAALRQPQMTETTGPLTGAVAHDFNTLLTIILGNLSRLQRRLADGAARDRAVHGKSVCERVSLGGGRLCKNKNKQ